MDSESTSFLYKQYYRDVYIYTLSLCKSHMIAEDILSETFLKVMLSLECADNNVKLWLFRVCKNLWIDHLRKHKKIAGVVFDELDICESDDFVNQIISNERNRMLYMAVLSLEDPYKESIILFYYLEMKQNEIAKILGVSDGATRTIIYRARQMLKKLLEGKL